ncbi:hypothetical protein ACFFWD_03710 [Bradyrhizobium erythrophlei]|uniref:hypothetical protein n=1 Tax=Bradyrhizobium erythrophlei TaxID=1437360 RepID=UPI0035E8E397
MADEGWHREFEDPIDLPDGRRLVTLRDAARYIEALPPKISAKEHWQTAIEMLIWCADKGGIRMMAHIAMLKALHHGREPRPPAPRKKAAKRYKIVR